MGMVMKEPIRIHHADTEDEVKERHARVETRLAELGPQTVRDMQANGELPPAWTPIIRDWLKDH
jgi:hypothetical protein